MQCVRPRPIPGCILTWLIFYHGATPNGLCLLADPEQTSIPKDALFQNHPLVLLSQSYSAVDIHMISSFTLPLSGPEKISVELIFYHEDRQVSPESQTCHHPSSCRNAFKAQNIDIDCELEGFPMPDKGCTHCCFIKASLT